jgi:hypothetical protein
MRYCREKKYLRPVYREHLQAAMANHSGDFQEKWAFPSDVKRALDASGYDVNPTPGKFASGRPKLEAVFYSGHAGGRRVLATRQAMELTSKKTGKPYYVCRREDIAAAPGAKAPASRARTPSLDDVYATQ